MRRATLTRLRTGVEGTFGQLVTDSGLELCTGELPWRGNEPGRSCIPWGKYDVVWALSPAHGWCYHVIRVPGRTDIEIHMANFCGDLEMKYRSDLRGCIALGLTISQMNGQTAVLSSYQAFKKFYADLQQQPFSLRITGSTRLP